MKTIERRLTVGYVRSATKNDLSIKEQEKKIRKYSRKYGYKLDKVFSDNGYSGANLDRPAFKKLLAEISKANIVRVICFDSSRLSRDVTQYLTLKSLFKKCETDVITIADVTTKDDANLQIFEEMIAIINSLQPRLRACRKSRSYKGK